MSTLWVTADHHFGHTRILEYCRSTRPWLDLDSMQRDLVEAWNATVKPEDTVYHLGDFAFREAPIEHLLGILHGRKILIRGNHDGPWVKLATGWAEVHTGLTFPIASAVVSLAHKPAVVRLGGLAVHLHGHEHGIGPARERQLDVGIDAVGPEPLALEQAVQQARVAQATSFPTMETA